MSIDELVRYRLSRAEETLEEARLLAAGNYWNAVANRLYYASFYAVNALLLKNNRKPVSHNGVKTEFYKSFVKTNIVSLQSAKLYSRLFNLRQEGDYFDFKKLEKPDVEPFISEVQNFIEELKRITTLS
ncbi:MAG: HEPN domain-containing protein [Prolixibacteraceae bacterium]|nr:HEPN domain-containing protein [Prolixibacteraceae bacterium]